MSLGYQNKERCRHIRQNFVERCRQMRILTWSTVAVGMILSLLSANSPAVTQEIAKSTADGTASGRGGLVIGHPFSAFKYALKYKVLPDGKLQFIRNERYPTRIARDADGRIMMQVIRTNDLLPECDHLEQPVPPICPVWGIFVIDPVANTIAHWSEGERADHHAIDFPLSQNLLERTVHATTDLPDMAADFSDEEGVNTVDLGERVVEGVLAHGVRTTLRDTATKSGAPIHLARIHEVWTAPEMKLIIRVIDEFPNGVETIWGLEQISVSPDPSLFRPPADYTWVHRSSEWFRRNPQFTVGDFTTGNFEYLESWFAK